MRGDPIICTRLRKRLGHVALFVALAVVPVLALNSFATADTTADPTARAAVGTAALRAHPGLTDAQRACLAEQGVTFPAGGNTRDRASLTEQRQARSAARRQAAETCGLPGFGPRGSRGAGDARI